MRTTDDYLLAGRIRYRQPEAGYRSGIEPILLAAAVPARAGELVLEAGTGAGAASLCLAVRVPGVRITGVEIQPAMAELARTNACNNGCTDIEVLTDRIESVSRQAHYDHAMANPPYHVMAGSPSPDAGRETAKRGSVELVAVWIGRLSEALRRRGSLTLIVPASLVPSCLVAMAAARCPCTIIFPLWPKEHFPAKLVLLRGIKEARTPISIMPGLALHDADGSFTPTARAILNDAAALPLDGL
jgi:tRNA1Val (adenine37-N6)-methyltransferase